MIRFEPLSGITMNDPVIAHATRNAVGDITDVGPVIYHDTRDGADCITGQDLSAGATV